MIVADASVVIAGLIDDEVTGDVARQRLAAESVAAPELLYVEVASALRTLERAGKLTARALAALDDLTAMPIEIAGHRQLLPLSWNLRHNVTSYDALYVALAQISDIALVTADRRLAKAVTGSCTVELLTVDG